MPAVPLDAVRVPQATLYGGVVSFGPRFTPLAVNRTPETPTLSGALALMVTVPEAVAPCAGAVCETTGGVTSTTGGVQVIVGESAPDITGGIHGGHGDDVRSAGEAEIRHHPVRRTNGSPAAAAVAVPAHLRDSNIVRCDPGSARLSANNPHVPPADRSFAFDRGSQPSLFMTTVIRPQPGSR